MESPYFDQHWISCRVAENRHRDAIGGQWDEIGQLQFDFLVAQGLAPHHLLVDVGCGCLRGGVHFAAYLDPGGYFGVDLSQSLLESGRKELDAAGIGARVPEGNLYATTEFELRHFDRKFDFALAQSLFTHLGLNRIRQCLANVADVLVDGGVFYATFFERPDAVSPGERQFFADGVETRDVVDPYHYSLEDLRYLCRHLPLEVEYVGAWNHPRGQHMVAFRRRSFIGTRAASLAQAADLQAGGDHYRAFVGPPDRFDFMSATQFALMATLGLRDHHKVLDFGCGSLRLGRLLIPFLQRDRYFGIDPARWLIEDGIDGELGRDALQIKRPKFAYNDDFDCRIFGETFDFVMAQSIVTHCGPDLFARLFESVASALSPEGIIAFSYCHAEESGNLSPGWHYPGCVFYTENDIARFVADAGLVGRAIPWYHPGARWYLAARSPERLPSAGETRFLSGAVLHDPQFTASKDTSA